MIEGLESDSAMKLKRADGRDENAGIGMETADSRSDVEELLGAYVRGESGFGDDKRSKL